ncbi:hypothetical protein PMAYCL1PPCAC_28783 [Pristionchus mayeri]|uniref:START domain-containing protein n=1 Tax=Pristionchus mayeri TaxID=1317129 RepID=A0AAN5IAB7_9BILA|nr:hypothetical protein PMAYCL1PPCAC_28783 [Pristionchus mayeri]
MLRFPVCILALVICKQVLAMSSTTFTAYGITDQLNPEDTKYEEALKTAGEAFREADALFDDEAFVARRGWKKENVMSNGDSVYSKETRNGKMVTMSTSMDGNVDAVMRDIWTGIDSVPNWDPNIDFASKIVSLTNYSDVVTYGNSDVLIVSGREVVAARIYRPLPNGGYRMAFRSVAVDEKPETKDKVRAHLYLGAVQLRPHPENPNRTLYDVVTLFDLKGMLPKLIINQFASRIMIMDTEIKVKHFKEIAEKAEKI